VALQRTGGGGALDKSQQAEWIADLARQADGGGDTDTKAKAESAARRAADAADELTVAVALREFERAVALVEDGARALCAYVQSRADATAAQARRRPRRTPP
jgi:hypothetical protein